MFRTVLTVMALASAADAQLDVLTANYDNNRTNANLQETLLTPAKVAPGAFGKLGVLPVDGQVYAQPLYVSQLSMPGAAPRNVLFIATQHNTIYAYDADSASRPLVLWHVNFGPSVPSSTFGPDFDDIAPEIGVLSTPVIDRQRGVLYVVSFSPAGGALSYRLHALDLATGQERLNGPVTLGATVAGNGGGSNGDGTMSFDPTAHLQRPGLLLLNNALYIAFGSHGDQGTWHGWLMSYDASDLTHQLGAFCTTPQGSGGSIWQSGHGLPADDAGNYYAITGNGDFDGQTGFSQSLLKFSGAAPAIADWYAPSNWQFLTDGDYDLAAGAAIIPGTHLLVAGDKYGQLHLVNGDGLGHVGGSRQVISGVEWGGIFDFAVWNRPDGAYIYVQEQGTVVKAYRVAGGQLSPAPVTGTAVSDFPFDGMAISANGSQNGILWETTALRSDPAPRPATLHAYDALTLRELWNSNMNIETDAVGAFAKFAIPTVANGMVYVPTFSNGVAVYGLMAADAHAKAPPSMAIASVANAASGSQDALSPGELVSIGGINLGPAAGVTSQVDPASGLVVGPPRLEVLFDGIAAPVLYASATQINAVVPFGAGGAVTRIEVRFERRSSMPFAMPVANAEPGIFSTDGSGRGSALVLNEDGSVNSSGNPAHPGSVVTLYATGVGALTPALRDGALLPPGYLTQPVLPIAVGIGGLPASMLYAGGVPGMVAGVVQVRVQIPAGVTPGSSVPVVLYADYRSSHQTVGVAVGQ
jgi:uncharacterized protein (TIGR03437 family)